MQVVHGKFQCNCDGTGYIGTYCDIDINECETERIDCGGKGNCINTRGSFRYEVNF